jgi:hypothetical protein
MAARRSSRHGWQESIMEPQRNGPETASSQAAPAAKENVAPSDVKRPAPGATDSIAHESKLPPVWIRLPDVGPDDANARPEETLAEMFDTDVDASDRRRWPMLGGDSARKGSSLATIAAVAILALTLYWVLPGRGRGQPSPPDNGPPPAWNPSPAAGRWRGPTAESLPTGAPPPPPQEEQTAGTPPDDVTTPPDQRFGAAAPWRATPAEHEHVGLADFVGTIETNALHRARREYPDAGLH